MDSTFMSNCANHPKEVAGISDMSILAEKIASLHYATLAEFLERLADNLYADAARDHNAGRHSLAGQLNGASVDIRQAHLSIRRAWNISKPFMNPSTTNQ